YEWNELFYIRGGYKINVEEQDFSLGAGFKVDVDLALVELDYSFVNFERLGSAHRFSIILGL
ncbi:MAG: hypothetical protein R3250_04140, partial [Melioribacteraceae bacterium]|nr:hypothetical protein [Melioribacteraceae bacterium]